MSTRGRSGGSRVSTPWCCRWAVAPSTPSTALSKARWPRSTPSVTAWPRAASTRPSSRGLVSPASSEPTSSAPPASAWTVAAEPLPETRPLESARRADVVVVGAGYTGLSAALHLAERGAEVVVLDAAEPGWGASGRNGGQIIPGLKDDPDELERKFGPETGQRMWRISGGAADFVFELIARHKISCQAQQAGWISAAPNASAVGVLRARVDQWRRRGAPVELLDRQRVAEL